MGSIRAVEAAVARRWGMLTALAAYGLIAFLYFGLPVAAHPGRIAVGNQSDPKLFIWMLAWWPHAIAHGLNPIFTRAIWAPSGYNLAWATSIPLLGLVLAPLTAVAGPVVAFNVAAVLLPALAAWTAFLLCRYVTRSFWPSLLGGYLFGFTSYMLGQEEGHLHLVAVCLVPLVALVVLRAVRGELSGRGVAVRLGVLLAAQILVSTEVLATLTISLCLAWLFALALLPAARRALRSLVVPVLAAYALAAAIASPFLYYLVTDLPTGAVASTPGFFVADAVNLVVPTRTVALGGSSSTHITAHFLGNELEQTAYLGIPLILLLCAFFIMRRRDPVARFLFACLAAAIVLAFGSQLHVNGHALMRLPWTLVAGLPILDNVYPERFTLYSTLVASVVVALWSATGGVAQWFRLGLVALVLASLAPNVFAGKHLWDERLEIPHFVAVDDAARCFGRGDNVLILPYGYQGNSTLWQALSGFRFRMPGGEIGYIPPSFRVGIVDTLRFDGVPPGGGRDVVTFAQDKDVGTILVDPRDPQPWSSLLAYAGSPKRVGGLLLYRIGDDGKSFPGC